MDEHNVKGYFFKPESSNEHYYFINIVKIDLTNNCILEIREITYPQKEIPNGTEIEILDFEGEHIITLYVSRKCYFPSFIEQRPQWYHHSTELHSNFIKAQAEVLEYALNLAIEKGGIEVY